MIERDVDVNSGEAPRPNGPRTRKGLETRARLLEAAKVVFERDGFLDARISDIAEEAGVSHGSFYHYFGSKEEAFREVATRIDEFLAAPQHDIIRDPTSVVPPRRRLEEAIRKHLEGYRAEARIIRVIEQVSHIDPHVRAERAERHGRYLAEMAESIEALQRRGLADARLDPKVAAAGLGSMTYRFPEIWFGLELLDCDFDEGVAQLTLLFVNALGLPEDEGTDSAGATR